VHGDVRRAFQLSHYRIILLCGCGPLLDGQVDGSVFALLIAFT